MLLGFRFNHVDTLNSQGGDHGFESRMRYQEIEYKKTRNIKSWVFFISLNLKIHLLSTLPLEMHSISAKW